MTTVSKNLPVRRPFSIIPTNLDEAMKFAGQISSSALCPNAYKGKPGDVLVAMQMGAEVGLSPMQAIQNIAVINGRPSIWGDAAIGLARAHRHCEGIKEWMEGSIKEGNAIAYCSIKRKGQDEETRGFSIENAIRAGLWEKAGPWKQYPERMLQMRARGFALRDVFPDALRGLNLAEEAIDLPSDDYADVVIEKPTRGVAGLKARLEIVDQNTGEVSEPVIEPVQETITSDIIADKIAAALNLDELALVADLARSLPEEERKPIRVLYDEKKKELTK